MNKIFKVVWSKVKHCYVVVSEIAKNTISGGARRCRVRKGALAAALVTAFLSSSFAMPNSAWAGNLGRPTQMGAMGYSYEALIVLSATKNETDGTVSFGIELYRGDSGTAYKPDDYTYLNDDEIDALSDQYKTFKAENNYRYTKVSSVGAQTEFTTVLEETIQQTVIQEVISSVDEGSNIVVTPQYDSNHNLTSFKIDAKDTKNESVSLSVNESNELVVSVIESDGTNSKTINSNAISLSAIDTNTVTSVVKGNDNITVDKETDNDGNVSYKVSAKNNYVKDASVAYDANGYEGTLTIEREGLEALNIEGLKDTYTTGVSVEGSDNVADVNFARNDGTEGYGVSFVGEGAVKVNADEEGKVVISATDTNTVTSVVKGNDNITVDKETDNDGNVNYKVSATNNYVKGASVAYDANGYEGTLTIEREGLDKLEIKGLKDTYTTGVSVEGSDNVADVNFARNDGTEGYRVSFVGEGAVKVNADEEGKVVISAVDTKNESVSLSVNESNELVVSITETDGTNSKTINSNAISLPAITTDTVTRIVEGSNVKVEELEADEAGNAGYKVSATNNYVKGASVSYDDEGYEGTLTIEREGLEDLTIGGLKDTYTTGVRVEGSDNVADVKFARNDGTEGYGVSFVGEGSVKVSADEAGNVVIGAADTKNESVSLSVNESNELVVSVIETDGTNSKTINSNAISLSAIDTNTVTSVVKGNDNITVDKETDNDGNVSYKVSAKNNYVKDASVEYDANGYEGTLTIEREGLEDLEIEGLKDTYTTGVRVEGSDNVADVKFARNDGTEGYGVSFVGEGSVKVSADEAGNVVIGAVDTKNESVSLSVNESNELVVSVTETDGTNSKIINSNAISLSAIDTDTVTRIVEGSNVKVEELKADEAGNAGYKISATNNYVKGASVSYDDEGYEGTLTIEREGLDALEIKGLKNTYTTGVSVSGNDVVFSRNDGSSYDMNFIADGGKLNAQGKPEDTYVQVSAGNEAVIRLNTGSRVSANENKEYQENQVLEDITINGQKYTLGYSWGLEVEGDKGNSGGIEVGNGQTLKLAEGENVSLAYNNGTITISALVKAEGKYADWQQPATRGGTTNSTTGLPQLSKLTVDGKEYSIPTINEIDDPDSNAPLLKAVELNGKEYRIADPDWTVKVANKLARSEAFSTFTVSDGNDVEYVAGSNIVLSAEATSTGGKITVATADNVGFNSVTVGGNDSGNVVINNSGIDMGNRNITGLAAGVADTDAVNVGQLRDVVQSSIAANDQHLVVNPDSQDGKYKVNGNTVTLKVQGKNANGGTVYTNVVIDDVASASSVNERFDEVNTKITNIEGEVTNIKSSIENINQNIANAKTEVEAGSNITVVEDEIDGGGKKYTISATDTNTTNKNMEGTGWVDGTDNLLIKVNDSDGESVEATIEDVAKASDLKQEIIDRQGADSALAGAIIDNHRDIQNLNAGLNKLGNRMNKVGAGSAALAALHPMDFDPDDKLQFSAGVGHYGGENAAALGAFYRPTEKVMFSVAGTMGNGEDMVNAGVTFALDKPNNVSNSRVAMAREIQDLRQQVAALTMMVMQMASRDNAALAGVAMFPDVPENHWAYDYIEGLQKQGIIEGYPDGNFGGDRSMTRYEFAAMLYRALEKGFPVDSRLLNEFNAELGRIRVDRIKGADNDAKKVERVRVNNYEDRDDYGSKIVQVKAGA